MKIFAVGVSRAVIESLQSHGFLVSGNTVETWEELFFWVGGREYDAIVIDIAVARWATSGVRSLREKGVLTVIIVAAPNGAYTNADWSEERAAALENGADDYIRSPINSRELIASTYLAIRRDRALSNNIRTIMYKRVKIVWNIGRQHVTVNGRLVDFTISELRIFEALSLHLGFLKNRDILLQTIFGDEGDVNERTIDSHIKRMRIKLNAICPGAGNVIKTVYGLGYKIEEKEAATT